MFSRVLLTLLFLNASAFAELNTTQAPSKLSETRQKKLNKVESLIHNKQKESSLIEKKMKLLMQVYRQQYQYLAQEASTDRISNGDCQKLLHDMNTVLNELDENKGSYLERLEKAIHCHELFSSIELLLREQKEGKKPIEHLSNLDGPQSPSPKALETLVSGNIDHRPRKRTDYSRELELERLTNGITVPTSIARELGIDKLEKEDND